MKRIYPILFALAASLALVSCREEALDPVSVITLDQRTQNDFDKWLDAHYVTPYNILVKYRFESNESDLNYWTIPARLDCSIVMAHLVKYLCIDTYDEVGGVRFTQKYFPKEFFYIGEWEYKNNGTYILGTAEGGKKILLSGLNYLPQVLSGGYQGYNDPASALNHFYIKTIHHEFTHILNQTKAFSDAFKQITPATYVADACFDTDSYWRGRGYITAYAQSEPREDFAELLSEYVTHNAAWWDQQIAAASKETAEVRKTDPSAEDGAALIESKIDIVRNYMQDSWKIDIDELRDIINRRMSDVVAGKVDLNTVEIL